MTTLGAPNVHAVAVDGTFDDCQDLVKAMFADEAFRTRVGLSAVNSINWARVMAQIVYYVWAAQQLDRRHPHHVLRADRQLRQRVRRALRSPYGAPDRTAARRVEHQRHPHPADSHRDDDRRSGRPDALAEHGHPDLVEPGATPCSNCSAPTARQPPSCSPTSGPPGASLRPEQHAELIAGFAGGRLDDSETLDVIRDIHDSTGMLVEPHTAVGIGVARRLRRVDETVVTLATAHPAKFPDAVEQATGVRPPLPAHLADLYERTERITDLPNDLATVEDFVDSVRRR